MDAGQKTTTRASDTQTHKLSHTHTHFTAATQDIKTSVRYPMRSPSSWRVGRALGSCYGFVVLLGWHGAADTHLKEFTDALEACGFDTARCVASAFIACGSPTRLIDFARQVLTCTQLSCRQADDPVALYVLSNGALLYQAIAEQLATNSAFAELRTRHRATVFDSAPVAADTSALTFGARNLLERALLGCRLACGGLDRDYMAAMREDPLEAQCLYLYSASDPLCDCEVLEALIDARKAGGRAEICCLKFDESEHVCHLREHAKEYKEAVRAFLGKRLGRGSGAAAASCVECGEHTMFCRCR